MRDTSHEEQKNVNPIIGISIGDINGIGPEVTIKALADNRILKLLTPVIYADGKLISYYRKHLKMQNFNYNQTNSIDKIHHGKINVINLNSNNSEVTPGNPTMEGGAYAITSLKASVSDLKEGKINGLVTAPISKEHSQSEEFNFTGHTEYLTKEDHAKDSLMFLVSEDLRIGVATGHIAIKDVPKALSTERIESKLKIMLKSLKKDFGIKKPRVAVLGLNPHAGENGLLGDEEINVISPIIKSFKEKGHLIFGPFPADGFFGTTQFKGFDGILAMYHDQGLVPFKNMAFDTGVNFTAGLSFIRVSPDHGTGFQIAGKNCANEESMRNAIFLAADIIKNREENQ